MRPCSNPRIWCWYRTSVTRFTYTATLPDDISLSRAGLVDRLGPASLAVSLAATLVSAECSPAGSVGGRRDRDCLQPLLSDSDSARSENSVFRDCGRLGARCGFGPGGTWHGAKHGASIGRPGRRHRSTSPRRWEWHSQARSPSSSSVRFRSRTGSGMPGPSGTCELVFWSAPANSGAMRFPVKSPGRIPTTLYWSQGQLR